MDHGHKPTASEAETFFHGYAADFDAIYGTSGGLFDTVVNRMFRRSMRVRYERTIAACEPIAGRTFLDVGCGPGHYCVTLAKLGAAQVRGVDFAENMLEIARQRARRENVADVCTFEKLDFFKHKFGESYDGVIVMGFMDYVEDAAAIVRKVLSITRDKALFSFPVAGGLLAWQRQVRYRNRCPLYLYSREQIEKLFYSASEFRVSIDRIDRDFFVIAAKR